MGEYVQAAYIAVGLLLPLLALLRYLHPYPQAQDLSLAFLLGMGGTLPVLLIRGIGTWPEGGLAGAFLTAGALEEGVKLALGALLVRRLSQGLRVGPAEGALVMAFLGAGFEAVEDFQYLAGWTSRGVPWGQVVAARALPMHVALGLVSGGLLARGVQGRPTSAVVAWGLAAGLHGGFNVLAGRSSLGWVAFYAGGLLIIGFSSFFVTLQRSPWRLPRAMRHMDPWEAGLAVGELGWQTVAQVLPGETRAPYWVLALGLGILYPLLVLGLGLLLQAIG